MLWPLFDGRVVFFGVVFFSSIGARGDAASATRDVLGSCSETLRRSAGA